MLSPLGNATYLRLFSAQVVALLGTGLATIALGLLAHRLGGASAGEISASPLRSRWSHMLPLRHSPVRPQLICPEKHS
jgi:hypothetical protein